MMRKKLFTYLLAIFIVTIMLIVFLQYNSNRNVNQLIDGNQALLTELQRRIAIHSLREDLYFISNEERRMITQNLPALQPEINTKRKRIAAEVEYLKKIDKNATDPSLVKLDSLVTGLMMFHSHVIDTGARNRKLQAELIMSGRGDTLMNKIVEVSRQTNTSRDQRLANLIETIDENGLEAKKWGIILAILAVVASMYAFGYIINKIRIQHQLIHQLNESEKAVKESALVKENFMANMSHEIRTPMNAILGFTELLRKQQLDSTSSQYVKAIETSGEHLLSLVNDVLDFSKMEAGMLNIQSQPFSVRELMESLKNMFGEKAKEQNIRFSVQLNKSIPDRIIGDAFRLKQILLNLAGNALKFTAEGRVVISANIAESDDDSIKILFTVKDTGIGIPQQKLKYVFERFNQVDEEASRRFGGTGLGLSIVKQLVELQHGSIEINSELNQGTEVRFTIPYRKENWQNYSVAESKTTSAALSKFSQLNILVVEDNQMNQMLMKHLLTSWNVAFTITAGGLEAINVLEKTRFDIVLMDIQLPGLDGYTTTKRIREELGSKVPIIAMTAHAMEGEKEKCLRVGMNAYIAKPVHEKDLIETISQCIYHQSSETEVHALQMINLEYLRTIGGGKTDFVDRMVAQFLFQGRNDLDALERSFEDEDYIAVKSIAHNLKTTVSFVGLSEKLDLPLSYIEESIISEKDGKFMVIAMSAVRAVCNQALSEAESYLSTDASIEAIEDMHAGVN